MNATKLVAFILFFFISFTFNSIASQDTDPYVLFHKELKLIDIQISFNEDKLNDKEYIISRLAVMARIDQKLRQTNPDISVNNKIKLIKQYSLQFSNELSKMLDHHLWISCEDFGEKACTQAFMIVQHAVPNPGLQHKVLFVLDELHKKNSIPSWHYAYLYDRIVVAHYSKFKVKQRFGSQWYLTSDSKKKLFPFEGSFEDLNQRRIAFGMPKLDLSEYVP